MTKVSKRTFKVIPFIPLLRNVLYIRVKYNLRILSIIKYLVKIILLSPTVIHCNVFQPVIITALLPRPPELQNEHFGPHCEKYCVLPFGICTPQTTLITKNYDEIRSFQRCFCCALPVRPQILWAKPLALTISWWIVLPIL